MWHWLGDNHGPVNAIASCLMLVVWLLYLQLIYMSFRRMQRPKILISIAGGASTDSKCILANMSKEPIYVEAIILSHSAGPTASFLSDLAMDGEVPDFRQKAMQGPLASGEMVELGSFGEILTRTGLLGDDPKHEARFSLTVIAVYAGEDRLVAAERTFVLRGRQLLATSAESRQLRSRRERNRLPPLLQASSLIEKA